MRTNRIFTQQKIEKKILLKIDSEKLVKNCLKLDSLNLKLFEFR